MILIGYILILLGTVNGCKKINQNLQLESYALPEVMAIDTTKDEKVGVTIAYPQTTAMGKVETQVFSANVMLPQEAVNEISRKSDRYMNLGQVMLVLVSEDFAREEGIDKIVKGLYQHPFISDNLYIAITKGEAKDYFTYENDNRPMITRYLIDLLKPNRAILFSPFTTLHDALYALTDNISDPMFPYIGKTEEGIALTNVALFKRDKMIDLATPEEANLLCGLQKRQEMAAIQIKTGRIKGQESSDIMLEFVKSGVKIKSNKKINNPKLTIKPSLEGQIYGYVKGLDLGDPEVITLLEKRFEEEFIRLNMVLLKKIQRMEIDPAGLGESFRMHYRGTWTRDLWEEVYKKTEIQVEAKVSIIPADNLK